MKHTSTMNEDLSFTCAFCSEYESLLDDCQLALSAWSSRSEYVRDAHLTGEAVGRELLRLQAHFAKSYDVLQKHIRNCERCLAASQVNEFRYERGAPYLVSTIC